MITADMIFDVLATQRRLDLRSPSVVTVGITKQHVQEIVDHLNAKVQSSARVEFCIQTKHPTGRLWRDVDGRYLSDREDGARQDLVRRREIFSETLFRLVKRTVTEEIVE